MYITNNIYNIDGQYTKYLYAAIYNHCILMPFSPFTLKFYYVFCSVCTQVFFVFLFYSSVCRLIHDCGRLKYCVLYYFVYDVTGPVLQV
jgi:hypothetical protein